MSKLLDDRSLALREAGRAVHVETEEPHLVSLNLDDPLATGVVLYYLHQGKTTVGRKAEEAPEGQGEGEEAAAAPLDIAIEGSGILSLHCTIEYDGKELVTLAPHPEARILVNGVLVSEPVTLHQGNTVHLGAHTLFRFNHPLEVCHMGMPAKEWRNACGNLTCTLVSCSTGRSHEEDEEGEQLGSFRPRIHPRKGARGTHAKVRLIVHFSFVCRFSFS
jgi:hypothetical protein